MGAAPNAPAGWLATTTPVRKTEQVVEIGSPSNTRSELAALEADCRSIGVPEAVFWHPDTRRLEVLRKRPDDCSAEALTGGILGLQSVPGLRLHVARLFQDPPPR